MQRRPSSANTVHSAISEPHPEEVHGWAAGNAVASRLTIESVALWKKGLECGDHPGLGIDEEREDESHLERDKEERGDIRCSG